MGNDTLNRYRKKFEQEGYEEDAFAKHLHPRTSAQRDLDRVYKRGSKREVDKLVSQDFEDEVTAALGRDAEPATPHFGDPDMEDIPESLSPYDDRPRSRKEREELYRDEDEWKESKRRTSFDDMLDDEDRADTEAAEEIEEAGLPKYDYRRPRSFERQTHSVRNRAEQEARKKEETERRRYHGYPAPQTRDEIEEGTGEQFIITKGSRVTTQPYCGPTCARAAVEPGKIYTSREEAEEDAARLTQCNAVGFDVRVYNKHPVDESSSPAYDALATWDCPLCSKPLKCINKKENPWKLCCPTGHEYTVMHESRQRPSRVKAGKLVGLLRETRVLEEAGFDVKVVWQDGEGVLTEPGSEAILADCWVDDSGSTLMLYGSEIAFETLPGEMRKLMRTMLNLVAKQLELEPSQVLDVGSHSPLKDNNPNLPMFQHPNSFYRIEAGRKVRKVEVRQALVNLPNMMRESFPGLRVG